MSAVVVLAGNCDVPQDLQNPQCQHWQGRLIPAGVVWGGPWALKLQPAYELPDWAGKLANCVSNVLTRCCDNCNLNCNCSCSLCNVPQWLCNFLPSAIAFSSEASASFSLFSNSSNLDRMPVSCPSYVAVRSVNNLDCFSCAVAASFISLSLSLTVCTSFLSLSEFRLAWVYHTHGAKACIRILLIVRIFEYS